MSEIIIMKIKNSTAKLRKAQENRKLEDNLFILNMFKEIDEHILALKTHSDACIVMFSRSQGEPSLHSAIVSTEKEWVQKQNLPTETAETLYLDGVPVGYIPERTIHSNSLKDIISSLSLNVGKLISGMLNRYSKLPAKLTKLFY